ncbi:hypothetical protein E3T19_15465 [Cryobacterium sp. TMT4-31]|nr:hypothetical protein E3T19_15465 [Cryobacterium sp. TMT4-31]
MTLSPPLARTLAILAVFELATLTVLLVNRFTEHVRFITQVMGPIHGAIYLAVIIIVLLAPGLRPADRISGCVPVVGGALALLRLRQSRRRQMRADECNAPTSNP